MYGQHDSNGGQPVPGTRPDEQDLANQAFGEALSLQKQNRLDEAAQRYEAILAAHPDHVPSLSCLCLCRIEHSRLEEAIRLGRRATELAADSEGAWHSLGSAQTAQGAMADAAISFGKMLVLRPGFAEGHNKLGNLLMVLNRLDEARQCYEKAVALKPGYAEAEYNLGNVLAALHQPMEAIGCFERAIAHRSSFPEACNSLGATLHGLGRHVQALPPLLEAVRARPNYGEAQFNLGNVLLALGRNEEAVGHYRNAVAVDPANVPTLSNLATALSLSGRAEEAIGIFNEALLLAPRMAQLHNSMGNVWMDLGCAEEARRHYTQAIDLQADYAEAHYGLGNALAASKQYGEAIGHYERALALRPTFAEAHNNLGTALTAVGRLPQAINRFVRAIALQPDSARSYDNLGSAMRALNRTEEALACHRRAIALAPGNAVAHNNLAIALTDVGRLDEAYQAFGRAVELEPRRGYFHRVLATTGRVSPDQLRRMEELAQDMETLAETEQMELHFALGDAYGQALQHERSFRHLLAANHLKRTSIFYDETASLATFDRIRSVFTAQILAAGPKGDVCPELPIFVLGMPRSGTTLVEQILASHPEVFGAGELPDLPRLADSLAFAEGGKPLPELVAQLSGETLRSLGAAYVDGLAALAPSAARVVDKMPGNFKLVGLIHLALPSARIIHVRRNPVDTCLSCFAKLFAGSQPYAYDLAELGRYYRAYERLMDHWRRALPPGRMLEVDYEEVVADVEGQARRMLSYCGLDWDDRCLAFHQTKRVVRTASATQVRQSIYKTSVGRWHVYGDLARPLLDELTA